jgi:hypothetical protein
MRLRQVALVSAELASVREDLFALFGLDADFNDPGVAEFGLENSVMTLGDTFLEVVSPVTENTTAGRLLEKRGGDGGYMVIVQVDNLSVMASRTENLGVRKVWEVDLPDAKAFHMHPRDIGGAIASFDEMSPPESWRWAGAGWEDRKANLVKEIVAVELQANEVEAMAERWGEIFNKPVTHTDNGLTVGLDGGEIHFVKDEDGRGNGVSGLEIRTDRIDQVLDIARQRSLAVTGNVVTVCGTNIKFVT